MGLERSSPDRLKNFFLALTRKSFEQLGIGDAEIAQYLAGMLADFSSSSRWLRIRGIGGRSLSSVVEMMLSRLDAAGDRQRIMGERELRRYVGDYTLFMSGLFRRYVERGGYLSYYMEEGKRSYQAVRRLDLSLYRPGFLIFEELSEGFESYSGALDYMRKCFFAPAPNEDPLAGFLKQIEGWVRISLSRN
jgi:hypothetical protein